MDTPKASRPSRRRAPERRPIIGWREWLAIPELGIPQIKAKVDTGARSSSLHAIDIQLVEREGVQWVRFKVLPWQGKTQGCLEAEVPVVEFRTVKSSTGHITQRPVILVGVEMMGQRWPIEVTLASRHKMGFRMLLGREAVRGRFLVDAGGSYYGGKLDG
jgi:hypothetical protein